MDRVQREVHESADRKRGEKVAWKDTANITQEEDEEDFLLLAMDDNPRTYKEVMKSRYAVHWDAGYNEEMASLKAHKAWTLVPRSSVASSRKIVGSRPHFHTKHDEKGEIYRHKVCVVAKGYSQVQGIDYTEMYAPISRMESMWTILHIGAALDWEINQLDVKTVFLHGDLEEEVYMEQPEGCKEVGKESWVYQLNKTLYSLKQARRGWSLRLHCELVNVGFERLAVDHSIYMRTMEGGKAIIGVHVDDMAVTATDKATLDSVVQDLRKVLDIVNMGPVKWF